MPSLGGVLGWHGTSVLEGSHLPMADLILTAGVEGWQVMEPEAGGLACGIPELVGLDDLIGLAVERGHDPDGVLDGPATWQPGEPFKERDARSLATIETLLREVLGPGDAQMRARREGDDEIPRAMVRVGPPDIHLEMGTVIISGFQIAGPGIVAKRSECGAHPS